MDKIENWEVKERKKKIYSANHYFAIHIRSPVYSNRIDFGKVIRVVFISHKSKMNKREKERKKQREKKKQRRMATVDIQWYNWCCMVCLYVLSIANKEQKTISYLREQTHITNIQHQKITTTGRRRKKTKRSE